MASLAVEEGDVLVDALDRVANNGECVVLTRNGEQLAAVVSIEDAELLEALEDRIDVEEATRILNDPTEERIPFEKVMADLGLDPDLPSTSSNARS